jgi:class 3 adenylate cyclase/pimeloyl-ACP methyl ester carboxylesterase
MFTIGINSGQLYRCLRLSTRREPRGKSLPKNKRSSDGSIRARNSSQNRRLAAIMFTDMVGYTSITQKNEALSLSLIEDQRKLIRSVLRKHNGREVKTMGDAFLVEFPSALDAVKGAYDIQKTLREFNSSRSMEKKIDLRVGVHLGDVVGSMGDISGDAVNVASRIEPLSEKGGVCLSQQVYDSVRNKFELPMKSIGQKQLKNVIGSLEVYKIVMPWENVANVASQSNAAGQQIRFCTSKDGVSIAYEVTGQGPPMVKAANWLGHLQFDSQGIWKHWVEELSRDNLLVRFDQRGCGLSDRKVPEFSFERCVDDLECVIDSLRLEHFDLLGMSHGGSVCVAYAVRHPKRVNHLIIYGAFARGWAKAGLRVQKVEEMEALSKLIGSGWGRNNPAFRQIFTSLFMPDATPEQVSQFNELQKISSSPENAVALFKVIGDTDVFSLLSKVTVPTIVFHARQDNLVPFRNGLLIASTIPGARFIPLESRNHILQKGEDAWNRFLIEYRHFIGVNGDV